METSSDARNPVELLAEEFLDRKRRGERPTLREYVERHPDLAGDIRDLFPALLMMEDLGEDSGGSTGSVAADHAEATGSYLRRLGDYQILREIGRGGMGVVYEAEQESLGRRVALKVLSAGMLADPKQVRRFEREAKAAARLHHTNIVPVFGVGQQDGHHYFVMQFISGLGLDVVLDDLRRLRRANSEVVPSESSAKAPASVLAARSLITGRFEVNGQEGPAAGASVTEPYDDPVIATSDIVSADSAASSANLPGSSELSASSDPDRQFYRSVARIGIQVAEALEYANRQGILHRDIKPSNLLLDNHGNVWVADFGLAKTAEGDDLTHTGDILGTIRYMAPERFSGQCDARSDVYSLGLTLYELVALRPAYEASDRHTLIDRVLHEEPERLKRRTPGVPRDLETIVAKATARDPAMRYPTAAMLADDLRRFVEDRPIRARRVSAAERLARWCKRNKVLAASIGVAATALLTVAVLSLIHAGRQAEATREIRRLAAHLERDGERLKVEQSHLRSALSESKSRLARLDLERGQAAFEKGQIGVGMLWTVESMRMASEAGDAAGRRVALATLSAWRRHHVETKHVLFHDDAAATVAFSPDGKTILTGCYDKAARLWDAVTGQPRGTPLMHTDAVFAVAFSPDGKTILTGGRDKLARLWNAATLQPIGAPLRHSGLVLCAAFSPDGRMFATGGSDNIARLWDVATGRPVGAPLAHSHWVLSLAFSPNGKTILTGSADQTARLWDIATGRQIGAPLRHSGLVRFVAFSPDGGTIATASYDKTARLWDSATGRQVGAPLPHSDMVLSVAFSRDGQTILTGCEDTTAQLWDVATGQRIGTPLPHPSPVEEVAFSPDGQWILTGCDDGAVRLWPCEVGQAIGRPIDFGNTEWAMTFSPDGKTLVTAGRDGKVRQWDVASGQLTGKLVETESGILAVAMSGDGARIVTGSADNTARLWAAATGRPLAPALRHGGQVTSVAFSPDGKTVLTGSTDNRARLWDAATGQPRGAVMEHRDSVWSVAFSPDGQTALTGSIDRQARRWDAATGQPVGKPLVHSRTVSSVAFSPDGKMILTGSWDNTARLWNAATGDPVGNALEHSRDVSSVAFSPDSTMILTGTRGGQESRLTDAATGQPIGPPLRHPAGNIHVAFSPDGRLLLTSDNFAARLWDAPTPLPDDVQRLAVWVEAATGRALDERGSIRTLSRAEWAERRSRLDQLGGPPPSDQAARRDPILFGGEPQARGDAWKARGLWEQAEAAYGAAIRARPLNRSVWEALAQLDIERGRLRAAAATLEEAVRQMPDDLDLRRHLGDALLWSADRAAWRRSVADLIGRIGGAITASTANNIAWICALGPHGTADPDVLVRLAELLARKNADGPSTRTVLTVAASSTYPFGLGPALYRAGRFEDAIHRLEDAIAAGGGVGPLRNELFLAMAHHRLGHREEARHWLDKLRNYEPSSDPAGFWVDLEIRLLRSEAEAVIVYDPVFPTEPFAP